MYLKTIHSWNRNNNNKGAVAAAAAKQTSDPIPSMPCHRPD